MMDIKKILDLHGKWLRDEQGGVRAILTGADLTDADLTGADLTRADLTCADLTGADLTRADLTRADLTRADLRGANLRGADLRGANLRGADLRGANLRGADLRGADLDFSCWPLWCGSQNVKVDKRLLAQLAAHLCVLQVPDWPEGYKIIRESLLPLARESHRAKELGLF